MKLYLLTAPDRSIYKSDTPGTLGGNAKLGIYGRLACWSAVRALPKGYAKHRVFFADEAAGYRPCSHCMRDRYKVWKGGGTPETFEFPRKTLPPTKKV